MLIESTERQIDTDVCVLGAGPAGITVALGLEARGVRTLLVEGGGFEFDDASQDAYRGAVLGAAAPYPEYPHITRLRLFGGTSQHWQGQCRPLEPSDLEARAWVPLSGWPIPWSELARWYPRAAERIRIAPFDPPPKGRFSVYADPFTGDDVRPCLFHFSPPVRFGEAYRDAIRDAKHVSLLLHAGCVRLEGGVTHAILKRPDGSEVRVSAKRFVLATGAIENARVLLESGLGGDWVGRCFMEHPALRVGRFAVWPAREEVGLWQLWRGFETPETGRARPALVTTPAFQQREKTLGYAVMLYRDDPEDPFDRDLARAAHRLDADVRTRRVAPDVEILTGTLIAQVEQAPNPESRIVLTGERDRLGMRRVAVDWRLGAIDARSVHRSTVEVARTLLRMRRGRVRVDVAAEEIEPVGYNNHHMGTTRMSTRPEDGVVDARCRVHGVENLWVAGSSVFATSGFANPTYTIVALAARLAEDLAGG